MSMVPNPLRDSIARPLSLPDINYLFVIRLSNLINPLMAPLGVTRVNDYFANSHGWLSMKLIYRRH